MPRLANGARRRATARLLSVARHAESRYVTATTSLAKGIHERAMAFLDGRLRSDAKAPLSVELDIHMSGVIEAAVPRILPAYDRMSATVVAANKRAMRAVGVKALSDYRIAPEIEKRRTENVALIRNASQEYLDKVKGVLDEFGDLHVDDLKAKLQERGDVAESRAELIARDQTLKLNGAITEIRQTNAGISSYVWSTSLDERVREEHAALEGQTFAWSSPPEPGHPGEDFQCRCVAIPVLDGGEDE